eukprot:TRINITY_DN15409_c0_g2_i1.p1 TRINITY_DN15409_c0_g2~~TRINITY_DN15409_c0_g2_i1.p1  ORF type:complete len:256 (-),score=22.31 TRINITY_DN15409_c0_g2_i1:501-1268(-)
MACRLPGLICIILVSLFVLKTCLTLTVFNGLTESVFGVRDKNVPSNVKIFNSTLPGVNSLTRISTTMGDTVEICILVAVGMWYKAYITNQRPRMPQAVPSSEELPVEATMSPTYFWSAFATHVRMGDNFQTAGIGNFWVPLFAFTVSRILAFIIGSIPGVPAGVPSMTTQLCLGIFFAQMRRLMYQHLGKSPGNFCADTLLYSCCCCIAAADDAQTVDSLSGVRVGCLGLELVGEPLIVSSSESPAENTNANAKE